ncbi:Uncharacterized protein QTN25_008254 [Entamoeba marina]
MANKIRVVVLHSHGGGNGMWEHLNSNWGMYGKIQLVITQHKNFSFHFLQQIKPDIIVCEFIAIERYVKTGNKKHLLGTYALFYHKEGPANRIHEYDNRRLAPLFGIDSNIQLTTKRMNSKAEYNITNYNKLLWKGMDIPYISEGYSSSQLPSNEKKWFNENGEMIGSLKGCNVLAKSLDELCIVTNYVTERFSSIYISHMPEYESVREDFVDCQFLYNCMVYLVSQNVNTSLTNICLERLLLSTPTPVRSLFLPLPLKDMKNKFLNENTKVIRNSNP